MKRKKTKYSLPDDPREAFLAIQKHINALQKGEEFNVPAGGDPRASVGSWLTWTELYILQMIAHESGRIAELLQSQSSS